uniref:Uncharacterized protein n=1 Tax=Branchiostoma floridae TaxID=7739 RepID=C3ZUP6_BRAFL|eukprot:XP_002587747.1 hypothetical protein BRAFLDRAFT_94651 [Branchiostoma floridae]
MQGLVQSPRRVKVDSNKSFNNKWTISHHLARQRRDEAGVPMEEWPHVASGHHQHATSCRCHNHQLPLSPPPAAAVTTTSCRCHHHQLPLSPPPHRQLPLSQPPAARRHHATSIYTLEPWRHIVNNGECR